MSGQQLPPYGGLPPAPGFGGYPGTAPYRAPPSYYQALQPWGTPPDSFRAYGAPPEHTVYAVEPNRGAGRGALRSLLSACSGLLCCCCLCDLLTRCL
ncbi:cysteine-rich and transmembrane domain-containing protein 1 isoform X4 [Stigmatopora argus]